MKRQTANAARRARPILIALPLPKLTPAFRRPEPHRRRTDSCSKPIPSKLPHAMAQLYEKAKLEKAFVFYTGGGRLSESLTFKCSADWRKGGSCHVVLPKWRRSHLL